MVPVHQLDLRKPGMQVGFFLTNRTTWPTTTTSTMNPFSGEIQKLNPEAAFLRSIPKMDDEDTDSASEDEQSYRGESGGMGRFSQMHF